MQILSSFLPIPKNVNYFHLRQLQMPQIAFKKWRHRFHLGIDDFTAQNKYIAMKLCMCVRLVVCCFITYITILDNFFVYYRHDVGRIEILAPKSKR